MASWRDAVWQAAQRQTATGAGFTREALIANELARIVAETGSTGATPAQTLSRELQDLRNAGAIIFDGNGRYRLASGLQSIGAEVAIATEVLRLQSARVGQNRFRAALDAQWNSKCPLTGIRERALLRASHIVPWNRCTDEAERLEPANGLLLSSLWDAAFDRGIASFDDDGCAMLSAGIDSAAATTLRHGRSTKLVGLTSGNRDRLKLHRAMHGDKALLRVI